MSEITQPPPDLPAPDSNSRVSRLNAASDQSTSNKQSTEQQSGKKATEVEPEKQISHHDPAVTLASTLSKLDAGSYFQATVSGHDGDGRTIIQSELGTYLVDVEKKHLDDFKKIHKDELLEIRVITIDKEIKAEIIRTIETENSKKLITTIPASLTLTELSHSPSKLLSTSAPEAVPTPLDDIRSQYNATTLYRAERIAREIGEKLDNLPFPTSAPNYTVYAPTSPATDKTPEESPRQVYSNVFIQEVSTSANQQAAIGLSQSQNETLRNILGQNISVEVIKTVPQTTIALPESLPEAVKNEIRGFTPLDNVLKGQTLNINISAIAIPEARGSAPVTLPPQTTTLPNEALFKNVPSPNPAATQTIQNAPSPNPANPISPSIDTIQVQPVISGIIVDALQTDAGSAHGATRTEKAASQFSYAQNSTGAFGSGTPEKSSKEYYLATPSTVLKFTSSMPLVAGTIVSFTIEKDIPANKANAENQAPGQNPATLSSESTNAAVTTVSKSEPEIVSSSQTPASSAPLNSIAPTLADRIDQFFPQELEQLTEEWSSISLAMSALISTASSSMAAIMASRIPNMQSPEQLTSAMFFFLSALKSATPARTWVGPDVSARLKQVGASRTIDRMDHDFSRIARMGSETSTGEWRPLLIPAQNGPDFMAIPMVIKHINGDEKQDGTGSGQQGEDSDNNATRFILEVNFSQFGRIVIDGLLKKSRLDIILKSNEIIPHSMKAKLSRKFNDAISNVNFDGELVITDSAPTEISVKKMIETMSHNAKVEKKI